MASMIAAEQLARQHNTDIEVSVQKDLPQAKKELNISALMQYITALEPQQQFISPPVKETRRDRTHPNEPFWKKLSKHKRQSNNW